MDARREDHHQAEKTNKNVLEKLRTWRSRKEEESTGQLSNTSRPERPLERMFTGSSDQKNIEPRTLKQAGQHRPS